MKVWNINSTSGQGMCGILVICEAHTGDWRTLPSLPKINGICLHRLLCVHAGAVTQHLKAAVGSTRNVWIDQFGLMALSR